MNSILQTFGSSLWREIKKHALIYMLFVKNSMMAQMEYRFNFVGNIFMECGYLLVKLSYIVVVYRSGVQINGMSADEILLFIGTFIFMTGFYAGMFMINNFRLLNKIKDGELDLLLTKPVSLQFMATLRQADVGLFGVDVIAGGIVIVIAWSRLGIPVTLATLGGFALFILSSVVVSYCLFLLPQILTFWMTNASAIAGITDSFWDFNNMPMGIYSATIQQIGIFILPIFVITNFPPLFLVGKMPPVYQTWALALPFLLLIGVRLLWTRGLRNYSSASS
ncbi:MAG: ABC-2 family transporter protein [Anaerolineales bacterium]|nr:ABC-2 family transporter protein [Anaerolineales bacterium]